MSGRKISLAAFIRGFLGDRAGAAAAEFALVLPVFLILIFGTIYTCMMMAAVINMHYAAERAARCVSVDISGDCPNVDTYAKSMYHGPGITGLTFTSSSQTCGNQVVGTGTFELFTGISATNVSISAQACYPEI